MNFQLEKHLIEYDKWNRISHNVIHINYRINDYICLLLA